ncbi:signal-transducing adaptor protein 1-like isoform X1 [Chiloscyllium plagiosum]|uniref:signal-transducing adaptor protein 1-like isoform X1 n=2 Tax=Chiloscyllium plagiosum TaxID=36176 RepID=UPI001CB7E695|nr:signal-transducing adaptor protein 1-like isoform X1 [Chiloscyllium plagiosum]
MAASRTNLRLVFQRREKITSLPLYYDGILWKKSSRAKNFQRYWSELRGTSIFFYCDEKESMYTEKLDLQHFVSIEDDNSGGKKSQAASFRLQLINEGVKLKAENVEAREEWKGYIIAVSQLEVPHDLSLLPGQTLCLEEVVKQETLRQSSAPVRPELQRVLVEKPDSDLYDDVLTAMPKCFYKISRNEAEAMLERHPENGNLILRPSTENTNYSISTLITQCSKRVLKHYRVTCEETGFIIWVDNPVTCRSLQEVIEHFIKETNGVLKPYIDSEVYADKIEVSKSPNEKANKTLPVSRVAPIQHSPVLPPEHPGIPGITKFPTKSSRKLPLKQEMSSRSPVNMEPEPSYMNDEFLLKMNQVIIADDRPPTRPPPKPRSSRLFAAGGASSDELMAKLKERRARLGD